MNKPELIIVSNRLPVSVTKKDGKLVFSESAGGLATAMSSLHADHNLVWMGWPGIASDDLTAADKREITRTLKQFRCAPVFLSSQHISDFYEGYSNDTLWPLFHYFQTDTHHNQKYWKAYTEVNAVFLKSVAARANDDSTVWIQDYHLMLLPQLLRDAVPSATIGFFLHIPFPSFELFRLLPERKEILQGLLGCDLIGFHIYDYARHFLSSCLRLLGLKSTNGILQYDGRLIKVDSFPIGIDYDKFSEALSTDNVNIAATSLREHHANQKIILSVDRLDYTKGILQRLEAYDEFLQRYPKYHKKVCLIVVAVPSRTEVDTYKQLRDSVEKAISRINGQHGAIDWTPISYRFKNLPFDELVALYSEADIALVTPLRDGMNLVAKEYVASKQKKPGVLILSEMAGAIDELPESLSVNPSDTVAMTLMIKRALSMPKREQRERMTAMQKRISTYTVQRWSKDFLDELLVMKEEQTKNSVKFITPSVERKIVTHFHKAKKKILLLDYDGTLKAFTSSHRLQDSRPPKQLLQLLSSLITDASVKVAIVSGRDKKSLESWFSHLPVSLIAEHGAWIKENGLWQHVAESFEEEKVSLRPILHQFAERTPGAVVEEKEFSLVWHYRDVPTELAYVRTANLRHELQTLIKDTDIGIYSGHKIIEIKRTNVTEGSATQTLLESFPAEFVLCIGDDYTDEDMFKTLPEGAYTIKVGGNETAAQYQLPTVKSVLDFLSRLSR